MDSNLDHAADDIRWIGERLKGLLGAADALKHLGSINNAIKEKTAIHDGLIVEIEARKHEIAELVKQIDGFKSDHAKASKRLAEVQEAHRRTTELLGGVLKQIA